MDGSRERGRWGWRDRLAGNDASVEIQKYYIISLRSGIRVSMEAEM